MSIFQKTAPHILSLPCIYLSLWLACFCFAFKANAQDLPHKKKNHKKAAALPDSLLTDSLVVKDIFIFGNNITRRNIILRELSFGKGDKLPLYRLDDFLELENNKIINTNLFKIKETYIDYDRLPGDSLLVNVRVAEKWYTWPMPLFELGDRNFNEWWNNRDRDLSRINYGMYFKRRNFRGRKELLQVRTQFGFTPRFAFSYDIPFLNKKQTVSLSMGAQYAERQNIDYASINNFGRDTARNGDLMWQRANAYIEVGKRRGFYNNQTLSLSYNNTRVDSLITQLNPDYFLNGENRQQYFALTYTFQRNLRDFNTYPLKGFFIFLRATQNGLGIFNDVFVFGMDGEFSKYFDLGKGFYYAVGATAKLSFPSRQPYTISRAMGYGSNIVRGYDNFVIEGPHLGIAKNTLRWQAADAAFNLGKLMPFKQFKVVPFQLYLKGYLDFGYVHSPFVAFGNERLSNVPLAGGGLGVDIVTFYNAVFRLEWSYNVHDRRVPIQPFFYFRTDI